MEEIDKEIAEKVMGWDKRPMYGLGWWTKEGKKWKVASYNFCPSTSISDAFKVVEKMMKDGWGFSLSTEGDPDPNETWFCEFSKGGEGIFDGSGPTAPLAICKAALAAKEKK